MTKQDINDFHRRVKNIESPRNTSYYDQDLGMHIPKRVPRNKIKSKKKATDEESLLGPFLVPAFFGCFWQAVALLARERYFVLIVSCRGSRVIDLGVTLWCLLVLTALIKRNSWGARFSQLVGVAAMLIAGHNLFWRWPDQMATIYTPTYANYVLATTEPPSLVIGATVYGFKSILTR